MHSLMYQPVSSMLMPYSSATSYVSGTVAWKLSTVSNWILPRARSTIGAGAAAYLA